MTDDLVKRLRQGANEGVDGWWFIMEEAADALEAQAQEIERLRACCKSMKQLLDAAEIVDPNL